MDYQKSRFEIEEEKINDFLKTEYTVKELTKLKDRIKGLALYGKITDLECMILIGKLPTANQDKCIINYDDDDLEEEEPGIYDDMDDLNYKLVAEKDEIPDEVIVPSGFYDDGSDKKLYKTKDEYDDLEEDEKKTVSYGFNDEITEECKKYNSDDDDWLN